MNLIPAEFTKSRFEYKQIFRAKNIAIYSQIAVADKLNVHYEVIIIQKHLKDFFDKKAGDEYYPTNEKWGQYGWTFINLDNAKNKAAKLLKCKIGDITCG